MPKRRRMLLACSFLPLGLCLIQATPENPFPFERINEHLYKIEVDANSIIASIGSDGVLLCDVGGESKGPRVLETIRALGGAKVDYIINTHWHVDHTGANNFFGKEAVVIAHENVRKVLAKDKYLKFWDEKHPAFPEYALPDLVFTGRMTIHFNGEDIEIIRLPEGHTDGDALVYFKKSNVLHAGDCIFSNGFPAIDFETGGNVEGFADNLTQIVSLMPRNVRIVVGHGPDYTVKDVQAYETMVRSSTHIVRNAMQKGMSLESMRRADLLKDWEHYSYEHFSFDRWIEIIWRSLLHPSDTDSRRTESWFELSGPYLGQKPPGGAPEIFAPGCVSSGAWEFGTAFSRDGKEFYFAVGNAPYSVIAVMKEERGRWTRPETASFSGRYNDHDMNFSPDGKRLFFNSSRPLDDAGEPKSDEDLWFVTRTESGWSKPENLGPPVNTEGDECYATLSRKGTLYFHRYEKDGKSDSDIFSAEYVDGRYKEPVRLGPEINSPYDEWDPYIAPDESYVIFSSVRRPENIGAVDMYICFRRRDGSWTKAVNMGKDLNSIGSENCAMVTPDGQYLFFMSTRRTHESHSKKPITLAEKTSIMNSFGNGLADIYWVDAKIIDKYKPNSLREGGLK